MQYLIVLFQISYEKYCVIFGTYHLFLNYRPHFISYLWLWFINTHYFRCSHQKIKKNPAKRNSCEYFSCMCMFQQQFKLLVYVLSRFIVNLYVLRSAKKEKINEFVSGPSSGKFPNIYSNLLAKEIMFSWSSYIWTNMFVCVNGACGKYQMCILFTISSFCSKTLFFSFFSCVFSKNEKKKIITTRRQLL